MDGLPTQAKGLIIVVLGVFVLTPDTLLIRLGARLALARDGTRSILPFPVARSAG